MNTHTIHKKNESPVHLANRASAQVAKADGEVWQRIAVGAYELYSERGCHDRHEPDDWLEAEREILEPSRHT